jgi:hypothetical protein
MDFVFFSILTEKASLHFVSYQKNNQFEGGYYVLPLKSGILKSNI